MGAEELETAIAIPLERARGPARRAPRSARRPARRRQVTIEFEPDADYYRARQFVAERIARSSAAAAGTDRRCSRA
jgi:cobalt-zinc-cadmium resistance protein CzcA